MAAGTKYVWPANKKTEDRRDSNLPKLKKRISIKKGTDLFFIDQEII